MLSQMSFWRSERSNLGICDLLICTNISENGTCKGQSLYETHTVSPIWSLSWHPDPWPWMTFKCQIKAIGFLMGCIFWMVVFQLTSWPLMAFKCQIEVIECLVGCISWIVHVIILMCVNNAQIWLPGNYGSDFEQYLNWLKLDPISFLVNFSHELAQIMTTYTYMTSYRLNTWFWAMFEPTLTWPNFSVGQLLRELAHIMTTYDFLSAKQTIRAMFEPTST